MRSTLLLDSSPFEFLTKFGKCTIAEIRRGVDQLDSTISCDNGSLDEVRPFVNVSWRDGVLVGYVAEREEQTLDVGIVDLTE